ncbi:sperm flagellar protein 2 [Boleophthalmus pectinirostris]|uniref:sperm flagellar protein 2 n=1 Tax=Boleophthalmus pectinirostris TaxID=150288 RepID=UPI00242CEC7F|nr:sperm flagellar protein 2 [Boleophthalmus pectinirostris]
MTDMLCRWLNEELRLSQVVEPKTFAKAFSSGYLFGEILYKYQLQSDFHMFMKKERSISMLNNFTRLEPSLHLLGISFSTTTAQELMQEKHGVAAHLVQQLYISLERKKKADSSGADIKGVQSAAAASLLRKEHDIHHNVNLQKISKPYEDKFHQMGRSIVGTDVKQKKVLVRQEEKSKRNYDPFQISIVQAPKPPQLSLNLRKQQQWQKKLAQDVQNEIAQFENNRVKLPSSLRHPDECSLFTEGPRVVSKPVPNSVYIQQIKQRLKEDAHDREKRDKRLDRFLMEQTKVREAEQNTKHEEYLLKRFTRPTKQEQRLVAQLHQIRKQKEVITNNRLFREEQILQRKEKDFQEALKREAVLDGQEKMARAEEIKGDLDFCKRLAADRDQIMYQKHSESCKEIVEQIVDLATKVGEYHLLYGNPVPGKQIKEWKEVLFSGLPLYEPSNVGESSDNTDPVELKKHNILNNLDYDEYINMTGAWVWPEEAGEIKLPPTNNHILGHVVARLRNLVHTPCEKPAEAPFPYFSLKACVLGKLCSGKTFCLAKIAQAHGFYVLSVQELISKALNEYKTSETVTEQDLLNSEKEPTRDSEELPQDISSIKLSTLAMLGREAEKAMMEGNSLPFELLVKIIIAAIQNIPANSGWILDGFPLNMDQARFLEKALGGNVEREDCAVIDSQMNLAVDPDPPKTPPPRPPALDLALFLDVSDDCAVSRAVNRAYVAATDSTPDYLYMAQIPHRITDFKETWPSLENWFGTKQKILIRVDANVDEEELFNQVESVLLQVKRPHPEVAATLPVDVVVSDGGTDSKGLSKTPSLDQSSNQELIVNLKPETTESSMSLSTEKEENWNIQMSTDNLEESSKMASLTNESSSQFFDKPLPPGIPEPLYLHWKKVCEMYVNNIKAVLQELRLERIMINQHFFNIKEEYKHYLGRPDLRQEVVSQWQKDFNSVADDMRSDEETKAELHLRLHELCEHLRNMCEKRKEENEQERAAIMGDGWLSDHTALLVNYHSILMQVELDRFQDTFCLLKTYYLSVTNNPLAELPSNLTTISLLDIPSIQALETQSQHGEHDQPQKKLLDDYEDAVTAVNSLLPAAAHQREVETKPTDKAQEKPPGVDKSSKKAQSAKKKKGDPSPPPASSPEPPEVKPTEYAAALTHEEETAKVRFAQVKSHGLNLVNFIQQSAGEAFSCMEKWLNDNFQNEIKSIEQLAEVVRHHIESGAKLLNELVLDCTHFCINGDYQMVALPSPPSRPPSFEKPSQSTLSIIQLESLCQQFRHVAPSGLLSSLEFLTFLKDVMSAHKGRNTLPETWVTMTETQLVEIVASLKDKHDLVDWRRFMLGCALPWPSPSVTQLLDALREFKAADTKNKGYISERQFLQTQMWFRKETVMETPDDLSKPLPYNRFSNLFQFFFRMFADHSSSPPRLNYTSMLLYFSADPNPKQGFVRALSVVIGQHLKQSSTTQLVKSMPSLDEVPEFSPIDLDVDYSLSENHSSNTLLGNQKVSISALLTVMGHSSIITDSQTEYAKFVSVYEELGYGAEESIPFSVLSTHSLIQHLMETSTQHQLVNIYQLLNNGGDCYMSK